MIPTAPHYMGEGFMSAAPVQVTIGGATLFIIDVDKMIKLSKHIPHNSPDFMFILNQCTSKKDKKFNEQSN